MSRAQLEITSIGSYRALTHGITHEWRHWAPSTLPNPPPQKSIRSIQFIYTGLHTRNDRRLTGARSPPTRTASTACTNISTFQTFLSRSTSEKSATLQGVSLYLQSPEPQCAWYLLRHMEYRTVRSELQWRRIPMVLESEVWPMDQKCPSLDDTPITLTPPLLTGELSLGCD